jgi:aryl-alcohol dehydrogenase-like predicted oxidoreductase
MQYTLLGNTGLTVFRLAFGAMTFTAGNKDLGAVYKVDADLAGELVGRALEAGINFFDTADGYAGGESEALLGAALKPHRDQVVIATKVGFRTGPALTRAGLSRRHILWSVDQSLKRLGTDWLKAAAVTLTAAEIAELDAATVLPPVYPNFFVDNIAMDRPVAQALGKRARR